MHQVRPVGAIGADTMWPAAVVEDLTRERLSTTASSCRQRGKLVVRRLMIFINGGLHDFLRQRLFQNYGGDSQREIPLAQMPDYRPRRPTTSPHRCGQPLQRSPSLMRVSSAQPPLDAPHKPFKIRDAARLLPVINSVAALPLGITSCPAVSLEAVPQPAKRLMIVPNLPRQAPDDRELMGWYRCWSCRSDGIDTGKWTFGT